MGFANVLICEERAKKYDEISKDNEVKDATIDNLVQNNINFVNFCDELLTIDDIEIIKRKIASIRDILR